MEQFKGWVGRLLSHGNEVSTRRVISMVCMILIVILSLAALVVDYNIQVLYSVVGLCATSAGLSQIGKKPDDVKPLEPNESM